MNKALNRREFIKVSAITAAASALAACKSSALLTPAALPTHAPATHSPSATVPAITSTAIPTTDPLIHTLRRLTFGLTPEMVTHAKQVGLDAWVEEQLHPERLDDSPVDRMMARFTTFNMTPGERYVQEQRILPAQELITATLLRQRFSTRQLFELMVDFWSNHFNIYIGKNQCRVLKTDDDLQVIRPNAMSTFGGLLWASAHSPAMLVYLDQATSTSEIPNENYAREVMELHTLSPESGYTQADVQEVARALTGLSVVGQREARAGREPGTYLYRPAIHDDGEKNFLGLHLPAGGGETDIEAVMSYLASHEWTAKLIAKKLARRFVADAPPESLVTQLASVFMQTSGDIRQILNTLIHSPEFQNSAGQKARRPLEFFISALRVTDAQLSERPRAVLEYLQLLGQVPFQWQPPNGYPDSAGYWLTTSGMLNRWNFTLLLTHNQLKTATVNLPALVAGSQSSTDIVDQLSLRFIGEPLPADARDVLIDFASGGSTETTLAPIAGLILGSPYFQMR